MKAFNENLQKSRNTKHAVGIVTNIQRYSIYDGPGIRTTVFFKGCPLRCSWCSNPEMQNLEPELIVDVKTNSEIVTGEYMTVESVVNKVLRDKAFYTESEGGITLSGGEVLNQPEFARALLEEARAKGLHTAVETTGYAPFDVAWEVLKASDLILYDLKGMDEKKHVKNTGVSNIIIKENLEKLVGKGSDIIVRIPVIPKHNDTADELQEIIDFASGSGIKRIEMLPYHRLGEAKYERLSREYLWKGVKVLRDFELETLHKGIEIPRNVELIIIKH